MQQELAWTLAEKAGSYSLDFAAEDMHTPDCLPWTLHFTHNDQEHHFAGQELNKLFTWALDFVDGKVSVNGQPLATA